MLTKKDIMGFLKEAGIKHDDKVTIHCSLRSIGEIENGADGLIHILRQPPIHVFPSIIRTTKKHLSTREQ